ncbi:malectin-A [Ceratitis capitata]|uniref:(Mediterranean fruit fly) hypothetical protein n=1 Tax=Ceratitis capitata TaxID=7213 RepID=W8CC03_CERCA|nr:malectin-A [Ceratitis capitata]CAD6999434.1 unnamed protein product [Ceratitis capitata]
MWFNVTFTRTFSFWRLFMLLICFCPGIVYGNLKVIYAVNAGGEEHTDKNGIHYSADPLHSIGTASDYGNNLVLIERVPEQDEVLFKTERYHTGHFEYTLPLDGDGEYALILKFCEVYFTEANKKIFSVLLNQHTVVKDLDIYRKVGHGVAHEEYVFFIVSNNRLYYKNEQSDIHNGVVRLEFRKSDFDNPKINAFALLKGDVANIPRLPPLHPKDTKIGADMGLFQDHIDDDIGDELAEQIQEHQQRSKNLAAATIDNEVFDEDEDNEEEMVTRKRKVSGPKQPDPYSIDDSSVMLPVFIAIGAFIPLLFCLCKL